MQEINRFLTMRNAQIVSAALAGCFLVVHTALLIFFWVFGVTPMVYVNLCSVTFYIVCLILIRMKHINVCVVGAVFEIALHSIAAAWCVGWDYGFQLVVVGGILIGFFAEYVGRCMQMPHVPSIPLAVISICAYVIAFFVSGNALFANNIAPMRSFLQVAWGVLTFSMVAMCMYSLIFVAFRSEQELSSEATHDELTGMPNRYFMSDYLASLMKGGAQQHCLAMVDIDNFKVVNDTYGHTYGDEVLKTVASAIAVSEANTCACRWGGEEFLMAIRPYEDEAELKSQMERLRSAISEHSFWHEDERVRVTVTIGVACYHEGEGVLEWVNRADAMLYSGKRSGKNRVVYDL